MDPNLHKAASKANIGVLISYKHQLLDQVTVPTQNTVLHIIAQYTDSAAAIEAVVSDLDSNLLESLLTWTNSEGETALYIATRNRRKGIVQQLLRASEQGTLTELEDGEGVGVVSLTERMVRISNKRGDTPLHEAVNDKNVAMVELLVSTDPNYEHLPNNMGKTPLYIALEKRVPHAHDSYPQRFVAFFLPSDVLINSYDPSLRAIFDVCNSPGIQGPHGETILHAAARWIDTSDWVTEICRRFPNIIQKQDDQGFTALHYAAYFDNVLAVIYLLNADESVGYITAAEDKHDNMTPLHIAASKGHTSVIKYIFERCEHCWDRLTSKGQNILHLAAKGQHAESIRLIMKQHWVINLLNAKDNDGNTPSHLLLTSIPKDYDSIAPLLQHPNVYVDTFNNQQCTPFEMLQKAENQFSAKKVHLLRKLNNKFWYVKRIPWTIVDHVNGNSKGEVINKAYGLEEMKKRADTHMLVATLIATVTFAAGFTLPGGYGNKGKAVLIQKPGFKAFIVIDSVALISSLVAICLHFTATLYKNDKAKISNRYTVALLFLVIAMISMAMTFLTGLYVVLDESREIVITIFVICCCGILYLFYLIRKVYRDMGIIAEEFILLIVLLIVPILLYCIAYNLLKVGRILWRAVKAKIYAEQPHPPSSMQVLI